MPQLVYLTAARRDIAHIAAYIQRESASISVAEGFVYKLTDYCEQLARLPGLLGRARPEFGKNYRSITFGSYAIIMRYADEYAPRSHLYIVHIIHGARDLDAYFIQHKEE